MPPSTPIVFMPQAYAPRDDAFHRRAAMFDHRICGTA
jgi:hypothetical protein